MGLADKHRQGSDKLPQDLAKLNNLHFSEVKLNLQASEDHKDSVELLKELEEVLG